MPGAVLWDMDGTLVDSEPLHEEALVAALRALGHEPPEGFHDLVIGRDARSIHAWAQAHLGLLPGFEEWVGLKYRTYFASLGRLRPRPGAVETFSALRARGVPQAVVSNSDRMVVAANLDAAGLTRPAMVTVSRNDVREGKPAPEPFLRAAFLLGLAPEDCVVVEDSVTGAAAGLAAGMRTLFWPPDGRAGPAGTIAVRDAADLAARIEEGLQA